MEDWIDECEFTHFIYENYDEKTADEIDSQFGEAFGLCSINTFYKTDSPQDEFDECMNNFIDQKGSGGKVQLVFTD